MHDDPVSDSDDVPKACHVLTRNLERLLTFHAQEAGQRLSVRAWTSAFALDPKLLQRASGPRGLTTGTLAQVASSLGLEAWQLLVEGFDPANPPELCPRHSAFAEDLAATLDRIPDPYFRDRAYAMALRVLETAAEACESTKGPTSPSPDDPARP